MGNSATVPEQPGDHTYERFGPVIVSEETDTSMNEQIPLMTFSCTVQTENIVKEWVKKFQEIDDSESREVLLLPQKHKFQKVGMCGSNGIVTMTFENFAFVLGTEIKNRHKLDRQFLETEMWYLLYNIVRAGNKFEKIRKKIGNVNLNNVVINDDGQIKVISNCSLPFEKDNYYYALQRKFDENNRLFLAPEEVQILNRNEGDYPKGFNVCKAEVFSIGLTILSSGVLEDCGQIYGKSYQSINQKLLRDYLAGFRGRYSGYLSGVVESMLALTPEKRRNASDIYKELYVHEDSILNLEPFPEKVAYRNPLVQAQNVQAQNVQFEPPRVQSGYGLPQRVTQPYMPESMKGSLQGNLRPYGSPY